MRKFYLPFLAAIAMMLVSLTAKAATYDLPEDNAVLQGDNYNMRLYKSFDFVGWTVNGVEITPAAFTYGDAINSIPKMNSYDALPVLNDGLENMVAQMSVFDHSTAKGLNTGSSSGPRWIGFQSMSAGQIIVLQGASGGYVYNTEQPDTQDDWIAINVHKYNLKVDGAQDWKMHFYSEFDMPNQLEDITAEIHALQQEANPGTGAEGEESAVDDFRYYRVLADGPVYFGLGRSAGIQGIQIWIEAGADEAVTTPSLQVVKVNGDARQIEFKAGESTYGNPVTTYYTLDGTDPIFLKDSEEVDHYTEFQMDEDGNPVLDEEGNPVPVPESAVYKRVLDTEKVAAENVFGDGEVYNPEDGSIDVYAAEDEDGDGIVVVKAVSVSEETGVVSEVVTINVSVGVITLDAPTLTLSGIDGKERTYTIGWNTKCMVVGNETYKFILENAEGAYTELEENTGIGATVSSSEWVKVTVQVDGYTDGTTDQVDVFQQGVDVARKNKASDDEGNAIHDWDFVNITDYQRALFMQDKSFTEIILGCYIATGEGEEEVRTEYTAEEYIAGEAADGTNLEDAIPILKASGWWPEISSNRTTLNTIEGGGKDQNENGFGYEDDQTGIFDGLDISCPPNANNWSCIFKYFDKADWADTNGYNGDGITQLGVYFMNKPTFTFSREVAKAGEIVAIYYGTGGSNWTSTRTLGLYEVPTDALLSVTLPQSSHVFFIDVYTYEGLPEDEYTQVDPEPEPEPEPDAINGVAVASNGAAFYTISGAKLVAPQKGINIVKYSNGVTKKVLVK